MPRKSKKPQAKSRAVNVNPKSIENLPDRSAPDSPSEEGPLIMVGGAVPQWMKDKIKSMPGSQGFHIRQALKMYLESFDN